MTEAIHVKMCCSSLGQSVRFDAGVGDTVLIRQGDYYLQAIINSILSPTQVTVYCVSEPDKLLKVGLDSIAAIFIGD